MIADGEFGSHGASLLLKVAVDSIQTRVDVEGNPVQNRECSAPGSEQVGVTE